MALSVVPLRVESDKCSFISTENGNFFNNNAAVTVSVGFKKIDKTPINTS